MKRNDGLFPVARQHGEARQCYGRAPVGWPQPFPRKSAPKCQKIALKMGVLSAKKWRFTAFLAAKPSVLLWNSGLGLKVTQAW